MCVLRLPQRLRKSWMSSGNRSIQCPLHCILTCLLTIASAAIYLNSAIPSSLPLLQFCVPTALFIISFISPLFQIASIFSCLHSYPLPNNEIPSLHLPLRFMHSHPPLFCSTFSHSPPLSAAQHSEVYRGHDWTSRDCEQHHCRLSLQYAIKMNTERTQKRVPLYVLKTRQACLKQQIRPPI